MRRVNAIKDVGSETLDPGRMPFPRLRPLPQVKGRGSVDLYVVDVCRVTGLKLVGFSLHVRWEVRKLGTLRWRTGEYMLCVIRLKRLVWIRIR
jgi:hypothetical protein